MLITLNAILLYTFPLLIVFLLYTFQLLIVFLLYTLVSTC